MLADREHFLTLVRDAVMNGEGVPFSERAALPAECGLYAIHAAGRLLYVGAACNIRKRWFAHHRAEQVQAEAGAKIFALPLHRWDVWQVEAWVIHDLRPVWNGSRVPRTWMIERAKQSPLNKKSFDELWAEVCGGPTEVRA